MYLKQNIDVGHNLFYLCTQNRLTKLIIAHWTPRWGILFIKIIPYYKNYDF